MRTTLNLDDDVLRAARSLASEQDRTLSEVVSELARKGLEPELSGAERGGFPVFDVTPDAAPITPEQVAEALDEV